MQGSIHTYEWTIPAEVVSDRVWVRVRQDNSGMEYDDVSNGSFTVLSTQQGPVPDIKANGSDETININSGDQLSIALSLNPGSNTGTSADWYIVVETPSGWLSFNISQMDYSTSGLSPILQNFALVSLSSTKIFSTSSLSAGTYTYYFAVILSGQLYYDSVVVNVQ